MKGVAFLVVALLAVAGAARPSAPSALSVGGTPLQLVAARGSLWLLTCDRDCSGEARRSAGRVVRIDPRRGRIVRSRELARPAALAVGATGVFATDFWGGAVRRLDPATLAVTHRTALVLPFELVPGDRQFLPFDVAVGAGAVWVSTARGVLARLDPGGDRLVAMLRLPKATTGGIAVAAGSVWVAESLYGIYRVDPERNRVVARIRLGPYAQRLAVDSVFAGGGRVLAVAARTEGDTLSGGNALVVVEPRRNRAEIAPLPAGPLTLAYGAGSIWVGRICGRELLRIDPETRRVVERREARIGVALAFAGGLWTVDRNGTMYAISAP